MTEIATSTISLMLEDVGLIMSSVLVLLMLFSVAVVATFYIFKLVLDYSFGDFSIMKDR